jgi:hypothetical protein
MPTLVQIYEVTSAEEVDVPSLGGVVPRVPILMTLYP